MRRAALVPILAALAALAALATLGCEREPARPNVILIVVDTWRGDHLGAAGFDGDITPHLDRLAAESIRFDDFVASAPWTAPSMASAFTSLHAQNHCVSNGFGLYCEVTESEEVWETLAPEAVTLAEVFAENGYETAGFVGNWVLKEKFGFRQGFETWFEPSGEEAHVEHDGILFERARAWLDARRSRSPFLLYVHAMDVHAPYRIAAEDLQALADSTSLGRDRSLTDEEIAARPVHLGARIDWRHPAQANRLRNWKLAYAAGVRRFDRQLGEFLDALREAGRLDDSIVVVTSDHGEEFLEHGEWEHANNYFDTSTRIPLIVRLPGGTRVGVDAGLASLVDLAPTLFALTGCDAPGFPAAGRDLSPRLTAPLAAPEPDTWAFSSALPHDTSTIAVVGSRYKLVADLELGTRALYDRAADPPEGEDLAAAEPETLGRLEAALATHLDAIAAGPTLRPSAARLTDEDLERLRSLGYTR